MTLQERAEREYVRDLARQVAEIAASEENARVRRRWRDVNALRKPDRPPVWCRPVGAWAELLPEDSLRCRDPRRRGVEREFRMTLLKRDIGDDSPVDGFYSVPAAFECDPPNIWGVDVKRHMPGEAGGAWAYDPPLRTDADFDRLRLPDFACNARHTEENLSRAHDLLNGILPVRLVCDAPLHSILCVYAAELRGLTPLMLDMADAPERVHRLMAHLRDGVLRAMRQVEATGLLTPNNTGPMTCSDPVGPPAPDGRVTFRSLWVMTNSQEFDQVSPRMWQEFLLDYQRPIVEQFGLAGYGCCENLTRKMDGVLSLPNLRIFVCSAWTDLAKVVERVGTDYVLMWRQKASDVVFPDDLAVIRRDLENGLRLLKGCRFQIVLRELQTLAGHPRRLHEWTRLAMEAAEQLI
jgi:hypothetical protein